MVCINPPQIQGILMYGVHKYVPVLGHINEIPKWSDTNFIRANHEPTTGVLGALEDNREF
jgi:hypothetical protein